MRSPKECRMVDKIIRHWQGMIYRRIAQNNKNNKKELKQAKNELDFLRRHQLNLFKMGKDI